MTMRCLTALVLSVLLVGSGPGCKKQPDAAPVAPATNQDVVTPGPQTALPPQKLSVQPGADIEAVLADLTKELRRWVRRNQRVPASFEEFISSAQLQPPPPPSGKKYVINSRMAVVLANR